MNTNQADYQGTWSFYDLATGEFTSGRISCLRSELDMNTPAGSGAMPGVHNYMTKMVDLETLQVIDKES